MYEYALKKANWQRNPNWRLISFKQTTTPKIKRATHLFLLLSSLSLFSCLFVLSGAAAAAMSLHSFVANTLLFTLEMRSVV